MHGFDRIINRNRLEKMMAQIILQGPMNETSQKEFLATGKVSDPDIILQSTSGSRPFLIPRSRNDILDIAHRMFAPYRSAFGTNPQRVALIGGVSHVNAASKLPQGEFQLRNFSLNDIQGINEFDPDMLSCYPSVMRDLMAAPDLCLKSLRGVNIGGEPVLRSDIIKMREQLGVPLIFEQYGSTEMPTMALKVFGRSMSTEELTTPGVIWDIPYALETKRFTFMIPNETGWHPIILKDEYPGLLAPFGCAYDMGDEGYFSGGKLLAVRRKGDRGFAFLKDIDRLLTQGCVNVQLSLATKHLRYSGNIVLNKNIKLNGVEFRAEKLPLQRQIPSNKLPVMVKDWSEPNANEVFKSEKAEKDARQLTAVY